MAIYELCSDKIMEVSETTFGAEGVLERSNLQRLLRTNIGVVSPDTFIVAEEFGQWDESRRRIDLLGLDKSANLVVIELKRTEDGGHMDLQAIRYAAMVSPMTFEQVVASRAAFQALHNLPGAPEDAILDFLEWDEPDEDRFAQDVRMVLVSANFSKELTTAVMWLNSHDLDIRCVRLKPYKLDGRLLLDVQQVIPLPEAAEYQVQVKEKTQKERKAREGGPDFTRFDVSVAGETHLDQWKRRAILLVVQALAERGVTPERIYELLSWKSGAVWCSVKGECDAEQFKASAVADSGSNGKPFDRRRWFFADDELIHVNGTTYAFTNQWGSEWPKAMKLLADSFPEHNISFRPTQRADQG